MNHNQKKNLSLYFHIPFCKKKCPYCHFFVLPDKEIYHKQLIEGLEIEWQNWQSTIHNRNIKSIYFGGGTPFLFGAKNIEEILSWIKRDPDIEVTLEANPDDINHHQLSAYREAGINRLSIGVQSFDNDLLKNIGRQHNAQKAINAIFTSYQCGIENISIDLMYDLPTQTLKSWEETLKIIKDLPITHLSLYNLTIEPQTVFHKYKSDILKKLPSDEESTNMYKLAQESLKEFGLNQYEISAFAKQNLISQHNIGYWNGREFLGLGPSAFSFFNGSRFKNIAHLKKYTEALRANVSFVDYKENLPFREAQKERLVLELRLLKGVKLNEFQRINGKLSDDTFREIEKLVNEEFLTKNIDQLKLTDKGILFYNHVASELI